MSELLKPLKIRNISIFPNLIMAPMSGITDIAFRLLIRQLNPDGLGLFVTEFISVEGLTRHNKRTILTASFLPQERPISIQIYGANVERMIAGAQMIEEFGADIIDINAGCPASKITRKGGGSDLLRNPELLQKIIIGVRKGVTIPVTLKIRSGYDAENINALEIAKMAEDNGIEMLTFHGRTRSQGFKGEVDWDLIGRVKQSIKIPVIGNGNLTSPYQALDYLRKYGLDGLMIGRQVLKNPWIFRDINDVAAGQAAIHPLFNDSEEEETFYAPQKDESLQKLELKKRLQVILDYHQLLSSHLHPKAIAGRIKQLASKLLKGLFHTKPIRLEILQALTTEKILSICQTHLAGA